MAQGKIYSFLTIDRKQTFWGGGIITVVYFKLRKSLLILTGTVTRGETIRLLDIDKSVPEATIVCSCSSEQQLSIFPTGEW